MIYYYKFLTAIILVLVTGSILKSQADYDFYLPDVQYLYLNNDDYSSPLNSRYAGIKVSGSVCNDLYSAIEERGDVSLRNYYHVPSFSGLSICQYPDSIVMDVGKEHAVIIKKNTDVGESWLITIDEDQEIFGVVDSINIKVINGEIDSVKYINIYSNDELLINNPIEVSKSYGLQRGVYFWDLLNESSTLPLVSNQIINVPRINELLDYEIDDVLHIETIIATGDFPNEIFQIFQEAIKIISVDQVGGSVVIEYEADNLRYLTPSVFSRNMSYDSIMLLNQIQVDTITLPNWIYSQPGSFLGYDDNETTDFYGIVTKLSEECGKSILKQVYPLQKGDLYTNLTIWSHSPPGDQYISNLGGPYYRRAPQGTNLRSRELVYTSNESVDDCYDQPFDFIGQLTNTTHTDEQENNVYVFPNPSSGLLTINLQVISEYDYSIIDINGRVVAGNKSLLSNNIDISNLSNGSYVLRILHKESLVNLKFIKN